MAKDLQTSIDDGDAYIWTAATADIDAGDTLLLVKNISNRNLHIDEIVIQGGNATSLYTIHFQDTATTTPAGTAVTGVPMNGRKSSQAETLATAKSDETGYSSQGTKVFQPAVLATTTVVQNMHGFILGTNQAIAIDQVTESTSGGASIVGHFA